MNTVTLRVRKASWDDLFLTTNNLKGGVVFIQRSLQDDNFSHFKCTSEENVCIEEIYHQQINGMLFLQQVLPELSIEFCSTSIIVPVRKAILQDVSLSKNEFKRGRVYFKARPDGTISNRIQRIDGDTHYGELAQLFKDKRLYVQSSPLDHAITINNPAFAKAV